MDDVATTVVIGGPEVPRQGGHPRRLPGRVRMSRTALVSAIIAILIVVVSLLVRFLNDPNSQRVSNRLAEPGWLGGSGGLLGTDQLGRSVAVRIAAGVTTTASVAIGATLVGFMIGSVLGILAGYCRGRVDGALSLACDVQLSFPALLVAMVLVVAIGRGIVPLIFILGLNSWMLYFRMARTNTLALARIGFLEGARALGQGNSTILAKHVFPNILQSLITIGTLETGAHMLAEVALSFLGFGIEPPEVSLGTVLADGRDYIATQWWMTTFAGLAISALVLCVNLVGKSLQPRQLPYQVDV